MKLRQTFAWFIVLLGSVVMFCSPWLVKPGLKLLFDEEAFGGMYALPSFESTPGGGFIFRGNILMGPDELVLFIFMLALVGLALAFLGVLQLRQIYKSKSLL